MGVFVHQSTQQSSVETHTLNLHKGVLGVQGMGENFHPLRKKEPKTGQKIKRR